jgi:hypothetical protein
MPLVGEWFTSLYIAALISAYLLNLNSLLKAMPAVTIRMDIIWANLILFAITFQ